MSAGSPSATEPQAQNTLAWLEEHGDVLYRYALRRVREEGAAEDLVQDTLLAAIEGIAAFRGEAAPRTWLIGILRRKIIDHFRRSGRLAKSLDDMLQDRAEEQVFSNLGKWRSPPAKWVDPPEDEAADPGFRKALHDCMDRLPPAHLEALMMRERSELSAKELGKMMRLSATNVHVILHRARMTLRACLERNWFGGGRD